jgi:uncharacterized protein YydD (DUF2326 family)
MLLEVRCEKFRTGTVTFRPGLNVVLGDENGTNSIGKSTLLMIVDFALGGTSLLTHNADIVTELGDHDYYFSFLFEEETYRFRRGTYESGVVYVCDEELQPERALGIDDYTALLKKFYRVDLPDLSFRALVGLYLRVWGKDNLSVERPLHVVQTQSSKECVDALIKTFKLYDSVRNLNGQLHSAEGKISAINAAAKHSLLPSVGKKDYANNQKRIAKLEAELADIRANLAQYATNLSAVVNREVLGLKVEKDRLLELQLAVNARLQRVRRNLTESKSVRSASFRDLAKYFPQIDQDRLSRVEDFHNDVARLLRTELRESEGQLEDQLRRIDEAIKSIDEQMAKTLVSVEEPGLLVDHVFEVAVNLQQTKEVNERFEKDAEDRNLVKTLRLELAEEKQKILSTVQAIVNDGMRRIVDQAFGVDKKSPRLSLRDSSYSFEVHDDTGTGTAYSSLVILDLTVLLGSALPVVAHDTLLFKNIANDSVAGLLRIYMTTEKQSFIALDEVDKYGPEAASVLRDRSVIHLDNQNVLYVKDWRTQ